MYCVGKLKGSCMPIKKLYLNSVLVFAVAIDFIGLYMNIIMGRIWGVSIIILAVVIYSSALKMRRGTYKPCTVFNKSKLSKETFYLSKMCIFDTSSIVDYPIYNIRYILKNTRFYKSDLFSDFVQFGYRLSPIYIDNLRNVSIEESVILSAEEIDSLYKVGRLRLYDVIYINRGKRKGLIYEIKEV